MKAPSVKSVHPAASIKSAKPASVKSAKPASVRSMKSGGGMNPAMVAGGAALGGAALGAGAMAMMGGSSGAPSVAGSAAHSVRGSVPPSVRSGGASAAGSVYDSEYSGYEDESFMDEGSYAGTIASAVH